MGWITAGHAAKFKLFDRDHGGSLDAGEVLQATRAFFEEVVWPARTAAASATVVKEEKRLQVPPTPRVYHSCGNIW